MKKALYILTAIICLCSCNALPRLLKRGEVVARVGDQVLYRDEIEKVIPKGVSSSDSLNMARSFIQAWAKDNVYLQNAEKQLPKADLDVTKELEDYRKSLLKYRYEQLYVNERLDTLITDRQVEEYYKRHMDHFVSSMPLVRARFLKIDKKNRQISAMRTKLASQTLSDLEALAAEAAECDAAFTYFNETWVSAEVLASCFETVDYTSLLQKRSGGYIDITKGNYRYLAYVEGYLPPESVLPVEMCRDEIRDFILSERKHSLVNSLEQDLLESARRSGKYRIY